MKKLIAVLVVAALPAVAENLKVKVHILERLDTRQRASGVIPGTTGTATTQGQTTCNVYGNTANCNSTSTTTQAIPARPAQQVQYDVAGAYLALQLPDGRIAMVSCDSKYSMRGNYVNRRSCRVPAGGEFEAEFDGKNAKLRWTVSLDGKKTESETYRLEGVLTAEEYAVKVVK